jgi:hypothetical protein
MSRQSPSKRPPGPSIREAIWAAIRKQRRFTVLWLTRETDLPRPSVWPYLEGLVKAGIVAQEPAPVAKRAATFVLADDRGEEAPRVDREGNPVTHGIGREQLWRTAKMLREFTAADLAIHASTEEHAVAEAEAALYARYLARAGYLTVVQPARLGGRKGTTRYCFNLDRNTGPKAPVIERPWLVYDQNERRVVWHEEVAE